MCGVQATWSASDKGLERIRQETLRNTELTEVRDLLMTGWPDASKKLSSREQPYWSVRHPLSQDNDLVIKGGRIVIPKAMRSEMTQKAHQGHQEIAKTKSRDRLTYLVARNDPTARTGSREMYYVQSVWIRKEN